MTSATAAAAPSTPWSELLGFLDADVVAGLEPLARRLHLAMGAEAWPAAGAHEPDGFDGIDRHGTLDRLLLSEWLLADEEPDEFTRRLAMAELGYLRPARTSPAPPARLVVLADVGPDQVGGPRLAQLAALAVLARRARALDVPLALGLLHEPAGRWVEGELPELCARWLAARTGGSAGAEAVAAWLAAIDEADEDGGISAPGRRGHGWYLGTGGGAEAASAAGLRVLAVHDDGFGPDGVATLAALVDGRRVELAVPPGPAAIRLLRGEGIRRVGPARTSDGAAGGEPDGPHRFRSPRFVGHALSLVGRGRGPDEVVVARLAPLRWWRRRFPGPVLAVGLLGTRTVALVVVGEAVRVVVVGKQLGRVAAVDLRLDQLGLGPERVEELVAGELAPLHFHSGDLLVRLGDQWWAIDPAGPAHTLGEGVAVCATEVVDRPRIASALRRREHDGADLREYEGSGARAVPLHLGPHLSAAHPELRGDDLRWSVHGTGEPVGRRGDVVRPDEEVVGVTAAAGRSPVLVVRTAEGPVDRILLAGAGDRTLLVADHGPLAVSIHPTRPHVAVDRGDGRVTVYDVSGGSVVAEVHVDQAEPGAVVAP